MKIGYILVGALVYSLLGCGKAEKRFTSGSEPLSEGQMNQMKIINLAQASALTSARAAFPTSGTEAKAGVPQEKAAKLVKMIKDANCAQTYKKPEDRYDGSWQAGWTVTSADCPINLNEVTEYVYEKTAVAGLPKITSMLSMRRTLAMKPDTAAAQNPFRLESGLNLLDVHGTLERNRKTGGGWQVKGSFKYDSFEVQNVGPVQASIRVQPLGEGGTIILRVVTGSTTADVQLDWRKDQRSIIVNGHQRLDDETYNELFSSFELLELLDQIKRMM